MEWSVEAIDRLRALWAEGLSTAEIGRRMGISKNAVVGKAHRLNLPARPSPIRRDPSAPRAATAGAAAMRAAALRGGSGSEGASPFVAAARRPAPPKIAAGSASATPGTGAALAPRASGAATAAAPSGIAAGRDRVATASAAPATTVHAAPAVAPRAPAAATVRSFPRLGTVTTRSCCWPIGEPGTPEFRFCEGVAMPGKPYCAEHAAVAYVRVRDRREDAP